MNSATLPAPIALDAIIRNHQTNDFPNLTQSYYRAFGALPAADQADPLARNMIDIDDGLALNALKTLKAADQMSDLVLESGNRLEDEAQAAAPGSAPFLTAAATAANIQSQAMSRDDRSAFADRIAVGDSRGSCRSTAGSIFCIMVRQGISDILQRQ